MARNFTELRTKLADDVGEDKLAANAQRVATEHDRAQVPLRELRRAREMTQTQLAKSLHVSQAQVSRVEGQADLYLSTLDSYIEAMGGQLELVATFDGVPVRVAIGG